MRILPLVVLLAATPALAKRAPGKGPASSKVKKDVKKEDSSVTKVTSVGKGDIRFDDERMLYYWVADVAYNAKSTEYPGLTVDGSCLAEYDWTGSWTYQTCRVTWQQYHGVKPPTDDQLTAAFAKPDWSQFTYAEQALGDPAPVFAKAKDGKWSFSDPMTASFPITLDVWHLSTSDNSDTKRYHATRTGNVRFTRPDIKSTTWTFQSMAWSDSFTDIPNDTAEMSADQRGDDAPTLRMTGEKAEYDALYADWKVPTFDSDKALAAFAYHVMYSAPSLRAWEAFMHQWWPDDSVYFKGKVRFWWGDEALKWEGWLANGVLGDRAEILHKNYCPTANIGKTETTGEDGETQFDFADKSGNASSDCSIVISSKRKSKAGTRSITSIQCTAYSGSESKTCN